MNKKIISFFKEDKILFILISLISFFPLVILTKSAIINVTTLLISILFIYKLHKEIEN